MGSIRELTLRGMTRVAATKLVSRPGYPLRRFVRLIDPLIRLASPIPIPPETLMYEGPKGAALYLLNGFEYMAYLRNFCGMKQDTHILDIGCGVARKAGPIIWTLDASGSYNGFDIVADAIDWCNSRYGSRKNLKFVHADIVNGYYNPQGAGDASSFTFPYASERFDILLASSLFTHLLPATTQQYLNEARRVMRPEGHFLATFFVLDEEVRTHSSIKRQIAGSNI